MATPGKLKLLEAERGNLERIIPPLVNAHGVVEAARKLKLSSATISKWLDDHDYVSRTFWQKKVTPEERADIEAAAERVNARRVAQGLPTLEDEAEEEFS